MVLSPLAFAGLAAIWMQAANDVDRADRKIALTARGVRALAGPPDGPRDSDELLVAAAAAESELKLEVHAGLLERAGKRLDLLPGPVREMIESGRTGTAKAVAGGVNLEGELDDLRLDVALIYLARGDAGRATALLAAARPPEADAAREPNQDGGDAAARSDHADDAGGDALSGAGWYQLLHLWSERAGAASKARSAVLASLAARGGSDDAWRQLSKGRRIGAAAVARREGNPALAAEIERSVAAELKEDMEEQVLGYEASSARAAAFAPAGTAKEIAALRAEIAALADRLAEPSRHGE